MLRGGFLLITFIGLASCRVPHSSDFPCVSFPNSNSCYIIDVGYLKTWTEARKECHKMGADLLMIDSEEEWDLLREYLSEKSIFWVELTDRYSEGDWKWVNGKALTTKDRWWEVSEPNNVPHYLNLTKYRSETKSIIAADYLDKDSNSLCKKDVDRFNGRCEKPWLRRPGSTSCYSFVRSQEIRDWRYGREACLELGGDLLVVNTQEEWDWIQRTFSSASIGSSTAWIGLMNRANQEHPSRWEWIDGTPLHLRLSSNYPISKTMTEDCATLSNVRSGYLGLNDNTCDYYVYNYICEMNPSTDDATIMGKLAYNLSVMMDYFKIVYYLL